VVALVLMVLFFALALAAVAGLIWLGAATFGALAELHGRGMLAVVVFGLTCFGAAGVIAWSVLPRIDRFEPPGPELTAAEAPALFAEIRRLSELTGQAEPAHVYLVGEVNAFVAKRGGVMGIGARRVMGIGLPLLTMLSVDELRAVLVHEYGHFHGGDVALGPWIYKTRGAVLRTVINLARAGAATQSSGSGYFDLVRLLLAVVRAPFRWFGLAFLRVTQAISRAQERGADALAARLVGSGALVEGLKKSHGGSLAFSAYFRSEVAPALDAGFRPPIAAGFHAFLAVDEVRAASERATSAALADSAGDPYDSHPSLRERVAAFPDAAPPVDGRPAIELVADVAALEARLFDFHVRDRGLRPIAWTEAASKVHVPAMRSEVIRLRPVLAKLTPATLPRERRDLVARVRQEVEGAAADPAVLIDAATQIFGAALVISLVDAGHEATTDVGRPVRVRVGGEEVAPFAEVARYLARETDDAAWQAWVQRLGIADVALDKLARTPARAAASA